MPHVAAPDVLDPATRHAVDMLALVAEGTDGYAPLSDHQRLALQYGRPGEFRPMLVHEGRHLVGYGHLTVHETTWSLQAITHPHHRFAGIEQALAEQAIADARAGGGTRFEFWRFHVGDGDAALARHLGLTPGRTLLQLRCPLPCPEQPVWPAGVAVRPFSPDGDAEAWLAANAHIFAEHPDQASMTADDLDRRMRSSWFDPAGFLLAVEHTENEAESIIGFCWTKAHPAHGLGEIYVIGVDPDRRSTGLGRSLVIAGLAHLHTAGLPLGMLYSDSDNDAARALYASLGFAEHHHDCVYGLDL